MTPTCSTNDFVHLVGGDVESMIFQFRHPDIYALKTEILVCRNYGNERT
jgi:hypothetical protein